MKSRTIDKTMDAEAYLKQGREKFLLSQYTAAIQDYDKAIELDPYNALAYYSRGNAKFQLKHYTAAIQDYDKAIELNPNHDSAYFSRGNAKYKLKQYAAAITPLQYRTMTKPLNSTQIMPLPTTTGGMRSTT